MQEHLREQAALARLGERAAVVAHENPAIVTDIIARIDSLDQMMKDLLLFCAAAEAAPCAHRHRAARHEHGESPEPRR
jgi:hypothetical protein